MEENSDKSFQEETNKKTSTKYNGSKETKNSKINNSKNNSLKDNKASSIVMKEFKKEDLKHVDEYSQAIIKTNMGNITVEFYGEDSPVTVDNFLRLADEKFYDGTLFHRVIKEFMIQGGDPNSKDSDWSTHGMGGPEYRFADEINSHKLVRGSLAMANSGPNTNGSQFFIVTADATSWLDGKHTNFGKVVVGMDVVDKIEAVKIGANDHPMEDVMIESIELVK